MFNNKQEEVIDKLLDVPHVTEDSVFVNLIEANNTEQFKFSSYVLADMWNKSEAVTLGMCRGRTANDFHSHPKWEIK